MDPTTSHRNWSGSTYHNAQTRLSTNPAMPASTYAHTDTMPTFVDPFINSPRGSSGLFVDTSLEAGPSPPSARTNISSPANSQFSYGHAPVTSATTASGAPAMFDSTFFAMAGATDLGFSTAPSPVSAAFAPSSFDLPAGQYMPHIGVRPYSMDVSGSRRASQHSLGVAPLGSGTTLYGMDQETPRAPYAPSQRARNSTDSTYFPSAHSSASSISSSCSGSFSQYGSMEAASSISDYSDVDGSFQPSIVRPTQPQSFSGSSSVPAQSSMMSQFSSKVSSSVQKKHVCKICEKRFTRPSSLQTHVYSHTGEKPYKCDFPGCGRCFSVVSNLRRHHKIHKSRDHSDPVDSRSEAESPESHITDFDD